MYNEDINRFLFEFKELNNNLRTINNTLKSIDNSISHPLQPGFIIASNLNDIRSSLNSISEVLEGINHEH